MEWISTKDLLPNHDGFVLVWHDPYIDLCFYEGGIWRDEEWIHHDVSHWMPVPEPPKDE